MKDQLIKAMACGSRVRIFACNTTNLINYAQKQHDLWPTASATLGRVLSVASMMGANLKSDKEKLSIIIQGGGPIGTVMADAYYGGNVRGFVAEPHVHYQYNDSGKLAVGIAVGKEGYLHVRKDMGMKEDFEGTVALQSGEIGEDFAYYFAISEQTPSVVSVGVLVDSDNSVLASGGLLIQMMPDATEEDIKTTETVVSKLDAISHLLHSGNTLESIVLSLYDDVNILDSLDIAFTCDCSREKVENALNLLKIEDLQEMIEEDHGCETCCQFCQSVYAFSEAELQEIVDRKKEYVEN